MDNMANEQNLLDVEDLSIVYSSRQADVKAVDSASLTIRRKEFVAIVGESGSGKSTLALSIIGLLPPAAKTIGKILLNGQDLLEQGWSKVRGKEIGMIFQEPLSSLNPVTKIGEQMLETIQHNKNLEAKPVKVYDYSPGKVMMGRRPSDRISNMLRRTPDESILEEALSWLRLVRIPDPESIMHKYPFELSGGMMQRVMIAMVLSQKPSLLLADEPTTALDATTQTQILKLMLNLREVSNASVILVTHDLAVAAQVADRVLVMYAGDIVEDCAADRMFSNPLHPYTKALVNCFPHGRKTNGPMGIISGTIPDLRSEIRGCKFADRCGSEIEKCRNTKPNYVEVERNHFVRCY